jgi:hypothetical protein
MAIDLSTAGIKMYYAVEATAGTRPTTLVSYTQLQGLKEIPEMAPAPESLETTTLSELEYKTYIQGLKDLGGALGFTFNMTQAFVTAWETLVSSYTTGIATSKQTWFAIRVPGITKDLFFQGIPSPLGMPGATVNSVLEQVAQITAKNEVEWLTALS